MASKFTKGFSSLMDPFFHFNQNIKSGPNRRLNGQKSCEHVYKPWFNEHLIRLHKTYLSSLASFNREKSTVNHNLLILNKRKYKSTELRYKRQYLSIEGDMLDYLRKHNPREFHKNFKQPKRLKHQILV